ncbi:hypothetical protein [Pseudomonas iridis]|uniref:hypothetical protein n=1 Tax=Pseudomonas iridis TaxID=2710587 RepID=UPI0021BE9DD4|nr:hypothetical protein [Pseudomonas iridis]MCT8945376.1 hypothetical protein [Pseudomonas iridis]
MKAKSKKTEWMLPIDFPVDDLIEVSEMLRAASLLTPGYLPPDAGIYEPAVYFYARDQGVQTVILPDRNVASRIAQLAKGKETTNDKQLKLSAALLGFAQLLNIDFEPGVSFHELAHRCGNTSSADELGWFRAADNAPPQDMLNVALDRTNRVSRTYTPVEASHLNLELPLKRWNRNYITALKILELDLAPGKQVDKMLRLLDWMSTSLVFAGPALMLACVYLGTHSPARKNVFKNSRSADRMAAIAGVRNAAWDITHLSDFILRSNESADLGNVQYLLASFDAHLKLTTNLLMTVGREGSDASLIAAGLAQWWGAKDAQRIAHEVVIQLRRINSDSHVPKTSDDPDYISKLILLGERLVKVAI